MEYPMFKIRVTGEELQKIFLTKAGEHAFKADSLERDGAEKAEHMNKLGSGFKSEADHQIREYKKAIKRRREWSNFFSFIAKHIDVKAGYDLTLEDLRRLGMEPDVIYQGEEP